MLLDVGGTLWPDRWPGCPDDIETRAAALAAAIPRLSRESTGRLVDLLEERSAKLKGALFQDTNALVQAAAVAAGLAVSDWELTAIRRAMCLPAIGRVELFPRGRELLATIKALGLRCVVVSNGAWRDGAAYRRDFADLGIDSFVDGVVTSADLGFRKPHPGVFEAALGTMRLPAPACAMLGDSERNDIEPALACGMRAVRVAAEAPRPSSSAAHAIAGSLHEAAAILRSWVWTETGDG